MYFIVEKFVVGYKKGLKKRCYFRKSNTFNIL